MTDIVIFGSGGFAREVHQVILDVNQVKSVWNFKGFLDDDVTLHGSMMHGYPVLGNATWLLDHPETAVIIGIGSPVAKRKVYLTLKANGHQSFATLIHPLAWVGEQVEIGKGTIICAGTMITTDIAIGNHVILNLDCTVGHDAVIEDFVTVSPSVNISGIVRIGKGCDLGTGSTIIQAVNIGEWSIIGAGTVVVKDLPPNVTAVGVPAKIIKERPNGWHDE